MSKDKHESAKSGTSSSKGGRKSRAPKRVQPRLIDKVGVALSSPVVIASLVIGAPRTAYDLLMNAVHSVHATTSQGLRNTSGEMYLFGGGWATYQNEHQSTAVKLATDVVEIARVNSGIGQMPPEGYRRFIQWVLVGNMSPEQATTVIAANSAESVGPEMTELVELIRKSSKPWTPETGLGV
jgi:hypothetical protein